MAKTTQPLPAWADIVLIPLINLFIAFAVSSIIIYLIGEDPFEAFKVMIEGAFGTSEGVGYTLYYATNFIFTGLAVAIAFHAMLFNIGGEGQAYIGGRWHGAIFAFSGGAVVIPLASENFKLEALMRQMNLNTAIFDAFNFDEKEIVKLTKDYLGQEQLRTDILERANSLAKTVNRHVALVSGTHSSRVLGSKTTIISHDEESRDNALYN